MDFQTPDFVLVRMLVERVLKGKGVQEGWTFFKGASLKGTGAGCPHVPQHKLAGKMTGLAGQGAFAGTQETKES